MPWCWWRRAEAGALDRQKDVDVGERRAPSVVAAPALTQQVVQLPRTVAGGRSVGGVGGRRWRVSGQVRVVPAPQRADQLIVVEPVVRPARGRRQHLPDGHSERPDVALRRQPSLNSATASN